MTVRRNRAAIAGAVLAQALGDRGRGAVLGHVGVGLFWDAQRIAVVACATSREGWRLLGARAHVDLGIGLPR